MTLEDITVDSLLSILHDPDRRADLIVTMEREQGSYLPVRNRYADVAERCIATPNELRATIHSLFHVSVGHDQLIEPFVVHPHLPDDVLSELCDAGRCLTAMSHRDGPQWLLERLAAEHRLSEAITTLALRYYSLPDVSADAFAHVLAVYKDDHMLRDTMARAAAGTLRRKDAPALSEAKRAAVRTIFQA